MTQRAEQNLAVARAALVEVVERTVQLRKSGREFIGICPFHEERTASFTVVPTKGFYHCFGCGAHGAAIHFVMRTEHVGFGEALRSIVEKAPIATPIEPRSESPGRKRNDQRQSRNRATTLKLWRESLAAAGSVAETYLREARQITLAVPPTLRLHPYLEYYDEDGPTGRYWPALLGFVQGPDRRFRGIHMTFLRRDGSDKAPEDRQKKMLGAVSGGALRLGPPAPRLAVAEGIEEALSIAQACPGLVVWSGLSTTHMANLQLPHEVLELIVCANRDEQGLKAARRLIERFLADRPERRTARLAVPGTAGDFNDLLRGRK